MKNKNRNFKLYILIAIIVLIGIFLVYHFAFSKDYSTNLQYIEVADLEKKVSDQETFILVVSQTGCSHCKQYLPELDRTLADYDLKANVINITELNDSDKEVLNKYVNFSGTPTTFFFIDGKEKTTLNRLVGYASKTKIIERLQSLGYIK